jgi:y4mF family transcriptional regulator
MNISSVKELGELIRRTRKGQGMTQPEFAGACGVGVRFIVDLEKGKETCEVGKVFLVISMLGIKLDLKVPESLELK